MYSATERIDDSNTIMIRTTNFLNEDIDKYVERFLKYKQKGVIINGEDFYSNYWRIYDEVKCIGIEFEFDEVNFRIQRNNRNFTFEFQDLVNAVKCFVLIILENYKICSIQSFLISFKNIISTTGYFNPSRIKSFRQEIRKKEFNLYSTELILDFLDYFEELNIDNRFYDLIEAESSINKISLQRRLTTFESMFKFDAIIKSFIKNIDILGNDKLERFFPIILWWYITSRIPLRATEFTVIPYDCLILDNDIYMLKLRRSALKGIKSHSNKRDIHTLSGSYRDDTVQINKELYDLIMRYKSTVDKYDYIKDYYEDAASITSERRFLLSYRSYYKFIKNSQKHMCKIKFVQDTFDASALRSLLRSFYNEIISNEFHISIVEKDNEFINSEDKPDVYKATVLDSHEIERIQIMDTRHFAIMNMILQDIPLVAIKELAGHRDIVTTYGYCNHIDCYIDNYTLHLAKLYSKAQDNREVIGLELSSQPTAKSEYFLEKIECGEIRAIEANGDRGWCIYNGKPSNKPCLQYDCECTKGCEHYIPKLDTSDDIAESISRNKFNIDLSLKVIKEIIKDRKYIKDFETRFRTEINKVKVFANQNARIIKEHML